MNSSRAFRLTLTRRILEISGALSLIAPVAASACSSEVVFDDDEGTSSSSGNGGSTTTTTTGITTTTTTGITTTTTTGVGGSTPWCCNCGQMQTVCIVGPEAGCPPSTEAMAYMQDTCLETCLDLAWVESGPFEQNGQCCYQVSVGCIGRPFVVDRVATRAHAVFGAGSTWCDADLNPSVEDLSADVRAALAAAWLDDALLEHASVAAFARFAMELMAVGAPSGLVEAAHEAALDEVRHARLCFALARAYAGTDVKPAAFPFGGSVEVAADLAAMAASSVIEGCVGETLAAAVAAEQLARATDPAVCAVLAMIAKDEARHAELAWRTVAWALRRGDETVRRAVIDAFDGAIAATRATETNTSGLEAHGRLDASAHRALVMVTLQEVVLPCARALLARDEMATARHDAA
jgi:hypothetical protein